MDSQSYDIQWIHHAVGDMKDTQQLSISDDPPEDEHDLINEQSGNGLDGQHSHQDYLVHEVPTEEDIDQIAAENLIFMAHDGQMVAEIINTSSGANNDVVEPRKETSIDCNLLETSSTGDCVNNMEEQEIADGSHLVEFNEEYAETQMVTEEVITDDWVQPQGEERVEIPVDQIICSSSFQPMDNEVPLPTVQDEYTALRPYPCDFCSRRFRKKTSLMNHIVAHQNDRPHLCKLCGSRFFRRSDLINHLKAHAEMPDPEFDDVEFMNFVEQTRGNQQHQQNHSIDHYYDQGRNNRSHCTSKTVRQNRKSNPGIRSGYSSSSSHNSRVRPRLMYLKEENNYTIDESLNQKRDSNDAAHGTQYDFMERHEVEATTATVKFTQRNNQGQRADKPNKFPVTDEKKPFVCQECGLAFAREKALMSHIKSHRTDSPYECKQCNEMFWDTSSLQDHLKTHQFEDSNSEYEPAEADETQSDSESEYLYGEFYCSSCGMAFHRQDLLKRHVKMHVKNEDDDIGGHCCNTCGETFVEALDLLAHAEIHARYPPFKCVLCGECFFEEATIKRHLHSMHAHEMTPNSCILCGKECRDRKALMKHAWDHSREKCHSCSKCGKNFHNKARLKRHMASHRDKSVNCDVCHEEFSDGRSLSNHRHSHSATSSGKLFPCTECGKTFGSRSSQQIHVRIHTGERPYGCRYCWKAFADGGTLRKHERIHTGEKPYACAVCPRAFNQRVVLREHIRTHHSRLDIKRGTYYCSVCGAEMDSSNNLIQHLIQHSDTNTAMHRQPATGPRKYKRRRKLKPHELAHLRSEHKANGKVDVSGSDIDISDLDMDNVEDFLGITESNSMGSNSARGKLSQKGPLVAEYVSAGNSSFLEQNHDSSSVQQTDTTSYGKERCNSVGSNSDSKLNSWQSRLMNTNSKDETYKSLLSNLENTLQSIDTLVVGSKGNVDNAPKSPEVTYISDRHLLSPVKTEPYSSRPGQQAASTAARVRSNKKVPNSKYTKSTRPRMIHTERSVSRTSAESAAAKRQRRTPKRSGTKMVQPAKQNSHDSRLTIDYDIILPGMQRQDNSTYSPVASIKHEYNNHQEGNVINTRHQQDTDIYDAELVLEASALRKDVYEKYNPNIVNDLEEMLRSPDKSSDKSRHRFASESSTGNYLVEQSEEELNIIKIEPTSPNIHDIVVGASNSTEQQISQRSTRRQVALSRKYLDFETESSKRSRAPKACRQQNVNKLPASSSANSTKNFMGYVSQESVNANSVPAGDVGGGTAAVFTSMPSVEAVALSSNVAQAANAEGPVSSSHSVGERKQRYYECEMCSAVFSDRAQLLDHVPIHI